MILLQASTSQSQDVMIPLSLYIHIPWCIQKCPYCDFNSHKSPEHLPEIQYVHALIADLKKDLACIETRKVHSVFIGGGTPSLFSAQAYALLFNELKNLLIFSQDIEITLEANPGTVDQQRFYEYRQLGINRLSLGIQSFHPHHLKKLGRIHDEQQAHQAIKVARDAGFTNINLDLMHSLPQQSVQEGLADLEMALSYEPEHLSWYQLTIEPNTVFYKQNPTLPSENEAFDLEEQGFALLQKKGYQRYEISAFTRERCSQHNLNYWRFGDYLGIGAGAHGKFTTADGVFRTQKHRQPKDYLNPQKPFLAQQTTLSEPDLVFEFMLNTTRLEEKIAFELFSQRTGLSQDKLLNALQKATQKKLIHQFEHHWQVSALGRRYTNDLQALFL